MRPILCSAVLFLTASVLLLVGRSGTKGEQAISEEEATCLDLAGITNLTITSAELVEATETTPEYCY